MGTVGEHRSRYWLFSSTSSYMSSASRDRVDPRDITVTVRVLVPRSEKLSVTYCSRPLPRPTMTMTAATVPPWACTMYCTI